jgi:hypothetical protein
MVQFLSKLHSVPVGILALVLVSGCKGKKAPDIVSTALPPAQASTELQKAFEAPGATASQEIKEKANIARQALANNDLEVAFTALLELKRVSPRLTVQEDMAVRNAVLGLVARTCAAAAAGDPKAKELAKRMQQLQ